MTGERAKSRPQSNCGVLAVGMNSRGCYTVSLLAATWQWRLAMGYWTQGLRGDSWWPSPKSTYGAGLGDQPRGSRLVPYTCTHTEA